MLPQPAGGTGGQRKSHIPTLGRLSRANTGSRLSNQSTQKASRSSSVGRHLAVNKPVQLFSSKRSSSYTNLRDPTSTPVCRLGRPSGTTPRTLSASKFPITDKQWVSSQLTKLKNFFLARDPEMPPLKPLNLRVFVHTMDLLLVELDNRIKITPANYKDEIPKYLNLLKYPHQIKASVLKNPGVPSNWTHIFALWVWLFERLSWARNAEKLLRPPEADPKVLDLYEKSIHYMVTRYSLWNNGQDETGADKDFKADIANTLHVDLAVIESLKLEDERLAKESNELKTIHNNILIEWQAGKKKLDELTEKNIAEDSHRQKLKQDLLARKKELLDIIEPRAAVRTTKSENIAMLKETIPKQSCDYKQRCSLKDRIAEMEYARGLKSKYKEDRNELILQLDMQLLQERQRVQELVCEINSIISKNRKRPELMALKIRETQFFQTDMIDEVQTFLKRKKEFDDKLEKEEANHIKKLKEVKEQNEKVALENKQLEKKIATLLEEQLIAKDALERFRAKVKKDVETAEIQVQQVIALKAEMKTKWPNVPQMEEKLTRASTRSADLLAERNRYMEKGEEFFLNIYITTVNTIAAQREMVQGLNETTDKALKLLKESIDKAEASLK